MRSISAQELVEYFSSSLAANGELDLFYMWLEEAVSVIRERPWNWNWSTKDLLTLAPVIETGRTFSWAQGDKFIICSAPMVVVTATHTGRKVKLGDEFYRIIDVGLTNTSRIYVDRPIKGTGANQTLSFVRDEIALPTTSIRTVEIDSGKIPRFGEEYKTMNFNWRYLFQMDTGTPVAYMDSDSTKIPEPAFPPKVSGVTANAWETNGKDVYYFFTRMDVESGLESAPGPILKYTSTGFEPTIIYDNPAGNFSESTSYQMVLYRSELAPTRKRFPAFSVYTRTATAQILTDTKKGTLYGQPRYYEGQWSVIRLLFPPDSTVRTVHIEHLDNWNYRILERENINVGNDGQVIELTRIYLTGLINLSNRSTPEYHKALMIFRSQMAYLVTKARDSGFDDKGPANHHHDVPGFEYGDWVDGLGWKS